MITREVAGALQMRCLSLKQPYPYFIFDLPPEFRKDIENRTRSVTSEMGPLLIAASATTSRQYFDEACEGAIQRGVPEHLLPRFEDLQLGVLYGVVHLSRMLPKTSLEDHLWKWKFPGHVGYVLAEPRYRLLPRPLSGAQTIYYVELQASEQHLLSNVGFLP